MDKPQILLHLDTDAHPSVFDRVVAVDAGAQYVFSYGNVTPENVMPLIHGCIFTRGPKDLHRTAIFIGGSDVAAGERLLEAVKQHLIPAFGLSCSVMLDSNGSNTTAAAAVRAIEKHIPLPEATVLILGGTGPVGQRIARLVASHGGHVRIGSRQKERAEMIAQTLRLQVPNPKAIESVGVQSSADGPLALAGRNVVVAAGAPGVVLLPKKVRDAAKALKVLIDLNGVPPAGLEGVEPMDKGTPRDTVVCYGALGVGGSKMKTHKAAISEMFTRNNAIFDLAEIYDLAGRV